MVGTHSPAKVQFVKKLKIVEKRLQNGLKELVLALGNKRGRAYDDRVRSPRALPTIYLELGRGLATVPSEYSTPRPPRRAH